MFDLGIKHKYRRVLRDLRFNFREMVAMYMIPQYTYLDKFGLNPTITTASDPEDVWEGGGLYPFSTSADIVSISSTEAGDTQDVEVIGQTDDYTEVTQTVTLLGQTRVALDTPLMRVYRASNSSKNPGVDFVGNVSIYSGTESVAGAPSGASVLKAVILNGNNQTQMALYTVPKGKVGFLYRGELGMQWEGAFNAGSETARIQYKSRRAGEVMKVKKTITLASHANSNYEDRRVFPDIIPSGTDVVIQVQYVSNTMGIWASFDMLLVDERMFPSSFLSAIGQV